MCIHFDCHWFQDSQMKPRFHQLLLVGYDLDIYHNLRDNILDVKAKVIPCVLCATTRILGTSLKQNL